jgi:hypothetical protein
MAIIVVQNARKNMASMALAIVIPPILHEFGVVDGRTLSVVNDIARKSPVIITMTMSIGVNTACPVITRPIANRSTCVNFAMVDRSA